MKPYYHDLIKHSGIYGGGELLGRFASFLLLPLYTRLLTPADYGVIAFVDVSVGVLILVISSGLGAAATRLHFDAEGRKAIARVWWTSGTLLLALATFVLVPMVLLRHELAAVMLGLGVQNGGVITAIAAAHLWFSVLGILPERLLRVEKRSQLLVVLHLSRLLLNVSLNVGLLLLTDWLVVAVLLGNLITSLVFSCAVTALAVKGIGSYAFDSRMIWTLWAFGIPLALAGLCNLLVMQADRYFLTAYAGLHEVGIYAVAFRVGQAVYSLIVIPFNAIWSVSMYEIAQEPGPQRMYARVLELFVCGTALALFAASSFADPILKVIASTEFVEAARYVPLVCLAFFFQGVHEILKTPALVAKRTRSMLLVSGVAVVVSLIGNALFVGRFGALGAASVLALSYATYALMGLLIYSRIDRIPHRLDRIAMVLIGLVVTFLACRAVMDHFGTSAGLAINVGALLAWSAVLLAPVILRLPALLRSQRVPTSAEPERSA